MEHLTDSDIHFLVGTDYATISVTYTDQTRAVLVSRPKGYVLVDTETMTTTLFDEVLLTHRGQLLLLVGDRIVNTTLPIVGICVLEN